MLEAYLNDLLDPTRPKQDTTYIVTKDNQPYIVHSLGVYDCQLKCFVYNVSCPTQLKRVNVSNIRTIFTLCSEAYSKYTIQLLDALKLECLAYLYDAIYTFYLRIDRNGMIDICNNYTDFYEQVEDAITDIINKSEDQTYKDFCRHFYNYYFDMEQKFDCQPNVEWYESKCIAKV